MPSWQWRSEWEVQEEPIAALFREVAAFERPTCSQHKRQNADIVCSVEFSPDGSLLASAGVAKQVRNFSSNIIVAFEISGTLGNVNKHLLVVMFRSFLCW